MCPNKDKKRIFITGASGLLGENLCAHLRDSYDILGGYHAHPVDIPKVRIEKFDLSDAGSVTGLLESFSPDIVIHCAALTNIDYCEDHRKEAVAVNVRGTKNIVDCVPRSDAKFIYVSTDAVYDGIKGNFSEEDPARPANFYGETKHQGEKEALRAPNALVLRTNFFGRGGLSRLSLSEWIFRELSNQHQIKGFNDAYFSSIYVLDLAKIIEAVVEEDLVGVYNCGSHDAMTKYDFAREIAAVFELAADLIEPVSVDSFPFKAARAKNLSLNVGKLEKGLGYPLPTISDSIEHLYQDYKERHSHGNKSTVV